MKNLFLFLVLIFALSCKDDKKSDSIRETLEAPKEQFKLIKMFESQDVINWTNVRASLTEATDVEFSEGVNKIERATTSESS